MYNITPVCVTMYLRYAMIVKYSFHSFPTCVCNNILEVCHDCKVFISFFPYVCVTMYLRYAMIVKYSFHSLILYEIFIGRDVQYLYQFILEGKNLGIIIV